MSKEQTIKAKELLHKGILPNRVSKQLAIPLLEIRALRREINQAKHRTLQEAKHRSLQEDKERLLDLASNFTVQALERLNREIGTLDVNRLAISFGIVFDKLQLLQGQATQRIETTKGLSQEQLIETLAGMKKARAREIEVEPISEGTPSPAILKESHYVNPHPNGYGLTPLN